MVRIKCEEDCQVRITRLLLRSFPGTGMFRRITVTFFYLLRCAFFRCRFQILGLFAFAFYITHNQLLTTLLLLHHFSTRHLENNFYFFAAHRHDEVVHDRQFDTFIATARW